MDKTNHLVLKRLSVWKKGVKRKTKESSKEATTEVTELGIECKMISMWLDIPVSIVGAIMKKWKLSLDKTIKVQRRTKTETVKGSQREAKSLRNSEGVTEYKEWSKDPPDHRVCVWGKITLFKKSHMKAQEFQRKM